MFKNRPLRIVSMFVLAGILFCLSILLIVSTWGTVYGRVITIAAGMILILVGIPVMISGIKDLIRAFRS